MIRVLRKLQSVARRASSGVLVGLIAVSVGLTTVSDAYCSPDDREDSSREIGVNVASAALTLLYGPVKLTYSALGIVFGGIAYGLSGGDFDVLHAVVTPAIHGDYIVSPSHVRREKDVEFFGRDPAYRPEEIVDSAVWEEVY